MLLTIWGYQSLGYRSRKSSHSSARPHKDGEKVLKKEVHQCIWERIVVEIGILIPATFSRLIVEVVKVMDIGLKRQAILHQLIMVVMNVGLVLPDTISLVIIDISGSRSQDTSHYSF